MLIHYILLYSILLGVHGHDASHLRGGSGRALGEDLSQGQGRGDGGSDPQRSRPGLRAGDGG